MELVIMAAGMGSRFKKLGVKLPKPLVMYRNRPLFWWSAMSGLSSQSYDGLHFVVLQEHIDEYQIDKAIASYFKRAKIHVIENVTRGAAETAAVVSSELPKDLMVAFLDCDLAFSFSGNKPFDEFKNSDSLASLCTFKSSSSAYSYVKFDELGDVAGTVEKQVVSEFAIAGLYLFKTVGIYLEHFLWYEKNCEYSEFFMSGVFNSIVSAGYKVSTVPLEFHLSLGTPDEIDLAKTLNTPLPRWYKSN